MDCLGGVGALLSTKVNMLGNVFSDISGTIKPETFLFSFLGVEMGKVNIQQVGNEDFRCIYVLFKSRFSSGTPLRVFASINYGNESSGVHDSAYIWVEDVTTSHVKVCLVQGGGGSVVNTTIDWFAFQGSQSGVHHGETSFSLFTTGTKCNRVAFPQVPLYAPVIFL